MNAPSSSNRHEAIPSRRCLTSPASHGTERTEKEHDMHNPRTLLPTLSLLACLLMAVPGRAQTWTSLNSQPPISASTELLLTDGTVIVQDLEASDWWKLTPDINGSYINGTWTQIASMPSGYGPLYFGSAVLADGRVVAIGGEYNLGSQDWTNLGAVYDPVANSWSSLSAPSGWSNIGDAQSCVLPNGQFLLADPFNTNMAQLDPGTLSWTAVGSAGKADRFDEEGWTMLPNGTIITCDAIDSPNTEIYTPSAGAWTSAGSTPNGLEDPGSQELGPQVLRPDGTLIAFGATQYTAIYDLSTGTWSSGPNFPIIGGAQYDIADGPACLLPSGEVLCLASPGVFHTPSHFLLFDGTSLTQTADTANVPNISSYYGRLLLLPTGQVMCTDFSSTVEIYTPSGTYNPAWQPTISSAPSTVLSGNTYTISGTQFNGLSQAVAYGDDAQAATNYPLVRITNNATGHVFYCRTHGHSTMAVATGAATVSTNFDVPVTIEAGTSTLVVVANGIPSAGVSVSVVAGPAITGLSPSSTAAEGPAFTLTVNGINFASGATVNWNGSGLTTTFVSGNQLTASVPATDIANPGTASITVTNPDGTTTSPTTFNIVNPVPSISSISPTSTYQGSGAFTLTVNGSKFLSSSVVNWNGTPLTTTFVSGSQLTASVPASDVGSVGIASVTVVTPSPGGGASNAQTFTITSVPTPVLSSISPTSVLAGGPGFTLTVTGSGFISTSAVDWTENKKTTVLTTSFVSSTQLSASVPASLIASAGSAKVVVSTPGAGTSSSKTIKILQTALSLSVTSLVKNSDGSYTATISLNNIGYLAANNTQITSAKLGLATTSTPLPVSVGNIPAGSSGSASLSFPAAAGASGKTVTLKVVSSFTGGTSTNSIKVKLP